MIFRGKTQCSICGEVLADGDDIIGTSHFIADPDDPLWRFSDSGMHRPCFVGWPLRDAFISRYNDVVGRHQRMTDDGSIVDA